MTDDFVVYHDESLIIVDKPAGLLSVPGRGPDMQDCVVNRVKELFADLTEQPSVHRLDMDTSGLLVLARTVPVHRDLSIQFQDRRVKKRYVAVLEGSVSEEAGTIELSFRLDPEDRPRQIYDPVSGKTGITRWRRLGTEGGRTRIEFFPLTGRTHQLRLHASHELGLGTPICGDRLYGTRKNGERLLLHAAELEFQHPGTGKPMKFRSEVPF